MRAREVAAVHGSTLQAEPGDHGWLAAASRKRRLVHKQSYVGDLVVLDGDVRAVLDLGVPPPRVPHRDAVHNHTVRLADVCAAKKLQ